MKHLKYLYIAYGMMWLSMAIAVSVGIYYTHSIHCLWFMLIPTLMGVHTDSKSKAGSEG